MPNYKPYNGFLDAIIRICREEGFTTLYTGLLPSLLLTSHAAIQFVIYEKLKQIEKAYNIDIVFLPNPFYYIGLQNRSLLWSDFQVLCFHDHLSPSSISLPLTATERYFLLLQSCRLCGEGVEVGSNFWK